MGCLNANEGFSHYFANIHLSGPCNRSCYFCIGQHMMALDSYNNLDTWPLDGLDTFIGECLKHNISEVNVTGSNTDPLLYKHTPELKAYLKERISELRFGIRTNGVLALQRPEIMSLYDKGSITICSFDRNIYSAMMGQGVPPDIEKIIEAYPNIATRDWKVNIVLGPENIHGDHPDIYDTILRCKDIGIKRINLREPYGQPHIGNPLEGRGWNSCEDSSLGMPHYHAGGSSDDGEGSIEIWYWDVHYVEVESVNLYANGRVSTLYPITAGHDPSGEVKSQEHFIGGRIRPQWVSLQK